MSKFSPINPSNARLKKSCLALTPRDGTIMTVVAIIVTSAYVFTEVARAVGFGP